MMIVPRLDHNVYALTVPKNAARIYQYSVAVNMIDIGCEVPTTDCSECVGKVAQVDIGTKLAGWLAQT